MWVSTEWPGAGPGLGGPGELSSLRVIPSATLHSPRAPFLPLRPERVRQAPPVRRRRLLHQLSGTLQVQLLPRLPAQSLPTSRVRRWGRPIRTGAGPQWCLGLGWGRRASLPSLPSPGPLGGFGLEPRGPASPGRSVTEGGPAEAPEHLAGNVVPKQVFFLPPAQTSTSAETLAPARIANARTNLGASSALPVCPATAARGAGPAAVRAGLGSGWGRGPLGVAPVMGLGYWRGSSRTRLSPRRGGGTPPPSWKEGLPSPHRTSSSGAGSEASLLRRRCERVRRGQPLFSRLVREPSGFLPLHVRPRLCAGARRPQLPG